MSGTSQEIRTFVEKHPHGWSHDEWLGLLHHMGEEGIDVSDPDRIGSAVERERVRLTLRNTGVKGIGPKRMEAIVAAYPSVFELTSSDGDQLAGRSGIPRKLAGEIAATWG